VLDQPPRQAWADQAAWASVGVGVPDMVRLAHALPEVFTGPLPLSVAEAAAAARDSWLGRALARIARIPKNAAANSTGADLLEWDRVTVDFGTTRALDDVSLQVFEGEWVALVGANGSGKSTLTGLPVGLGQPSSGQVRLRGKPIRPGRVFDQAAQVALLLQAADEMLFEQTVLGELSFGRKFRAPPSNPVLTLDEAIEFFGFAGLEEVSPWELSQGGRQRLALAALLVGAPGVLILDEPTTGQDAQRMASFLRRLESVRDRTGLTVLTVTHDIRGLASRADRIVVMGVGKVALDGPARQVLARTEELARCGVLAPPVARLQTELLGPATDNVLLSVEELVATALYPYELAPS
jgi:energy-coupling factor transporter ATP-binding protein EcfA2